MNLYITKDLRLYITLPWHEEVAHVTFPFTILRVLHSITSLNKHLLKLLKLFQFNTSIHGKEGWEEWEEERDEEEKDEEDKDEEEKDEEEKDEEEKDDEEID